MGKCAFCNGQIGALTDRRKLRGLQYCLGCVPKALDQRRQQTIQQIQDPSPPRVLFHVPVVSRDLDNPSGSRRYAGVLLFTDRGIIFTQFAEWDGGGGMGVLMLLMGGWLLALIMLIASDKDNKAVQQAASREVLSVTGDGLELLDQAKQVFFFPLQRISMLSANNVRCSLKIGKTVTWFQWQDGKKTISPYKERLDAYVQAANSGQGVASVR